MDDFSTALEKCGARGAQYVVVANHDPSSGTASALLLKNLEHIKAFGFSNVVLEGPTPMAGNVKDSPGFMGEGWDKDPFLKGYLQKFGNTESAGHYQAMWKQGQTVGLDVHVIGSNEIFQRADPQSLLAEAGRAIEHLKQQESRETTPLTQLLNGMSRALTSENVAAQQDAQTILGRMQGQHDNLKNTNDYYVQRMLDANSRVVNEAPQIAGQIKALPGRSLILYSTDFLWRNNDLDEALGPSVCRVNIRNGHLQPPAKVSTSPLAQSLGYVSSWTADTTVDVTARAVTEPSLDGQKISRNTSATRPAAGNTNKFD